jgi:Undecaprenyl-phosphate galactose phosphotransferase WbaP
MRQDIAFEHVGIPAPVRTHGVLRVSTLALTDAGALVAAGIGAHFLSTFAVPEGQPWQFWQLMAAVPLFSLAYASAGLYPGFGVTAVQMLRATFRQTSFVLLAILACAYAFRVGEPLGLGTLALWWALAVVAVPLGRACLAWRAASWSWWREPVLLVGDAPRLEALTESLARSHHVGYRPVAVCLSSNLATLPDAWRDLPVLAATDVVGVARRLHVSTVLVAAPAGQGERWAAELSDHVRRVVSVLSIEEGYVEPTAVRHLGQAVGLEIHKRLLVRRNQAAKRVLDLAIAVPALVLSLPILALAAIAIVRRDPGPFLHVQPREGLDGRVFRMWKLRTMYGDAEARLVEHLHHDARAREEWEREFKLTGDPRVLPGIGTLLRRWSLDECPQLWNVLRGEMSLVGPRALPAYHLQAFGPAFRARRQRVRPGMTGMWQVMSRGTGAVRTQEALDGYYISNWSIWMDIFLLAKTVQAVMSGRGAR